MMNLFLLVVSAVILASVRGRCRFPPDKLSAKIEKYNKACLLKGFNTDIEGCVRVEADSNKLRWNEKRKCAELEKYLIKCDHSCNGGWGEYGEWSECSAECDGGTQTRTKECNNPAPQHGGADCEGEGEETRDCNTHSCPVDGGWSEYGEWSECSAECDGGTQTRTKECNNPAPQHGGADCEGEGEETRDCNTHSCPVDGGWSEYGEWSECSAECDGGTQTRTKECNNPAPQHGGADCEGEGEETRNCNTHSCPVDGGWSEYGEWSECSAECDGGTQTRTKECNNPAPQHGGADCEGEGEETRDCNTHSCEEFTLVDSNGDPVGEGVEGLLLFNGGTVCDDSFSYNSATAICRQLGYSDVSIWSSGQQWSIQSNYSINIADVRCNGDLWSSCTYATSNNCGHYEDVFLICGQVEDGWSEWSEWDSSCEQCGGNQTRSRECEGHWYQCTDGSKVETKDCPPCRTLTEKFGTEDHENIAAFGTASQKDSAYKGFADRAIDGNTNGDFAGKSVTHTKSSGSDVFWKLHFSTPQYIEHVVVWGRTDCCRARIDGAKFLIDHVEMGELQSGEMTDDKIEFDVGGFGKEIMIKGPRKYLSLAEVQVFGVRSEFRDIAEDAEQSGTERTGESVVQHWTFEEERLLNSFVLNYPDTATARDVDGTKVFVGGVKIGQVEFQDGKNSYVFGGLEGRHSRFTIEEPASESQFSDFEIYGE
ncbi:hypothetical protein ACHWQZ_G000747 [Mnemiopsis leidyi]